jgi:hypothetical protein
MPAVGNFPQSRMREIFMSGSSRGEWVAPLAESPSLLLYRYASFVSGHEESAFPRATPLLVNRRLRRSKPGTAGRDRGESRRLAEMRESALPCLLIRDDEGSQRNAKNAYLCATRVSPYGASPTVHGLMTGTPAALNGASSRAATLNWRAAAIAAIWASATLRGWPWRRARTTIFA